MWLVLCEPGDVDAHWAHAGLGARGLAPVELVTTDALVAAPRWEHRLGAGGVSTRIELADGRTIESAEVRGALNRLVGVRPELLARAAPSDREYATQELHALLMSWLAGLPGRVLNRPSAQGLSGRWLERSEWFLLAARAGLPTPRYRSGPSGRPARGMVDCPRRTVTVVGDRALGPPAVPTAIEFAGVYTRVMDEQRLPELAGEPSRSPLRRQARRLHFVLAEWCELTPARVVNRARPQGSNFSKPYQAQLIRRHGFAVPETVVTNDPELVRDFLSSHNRVVYKSISGVRSIVKLLDPDDLERLDRIAWCPVQLQAYVPGTDVRVHVVADEVYPTAVRTDATDYRYALRQGTGPAELEAIELPDELAERCVSLAAALDLPFAGIDLRLSPSREATCFEVNPSPAFSWFESATGQPIAAAVARYLLGLSC